MLQYQTKGLADFSGNNLCSTDSSCMLWQHMQVMQKSLEASELSFREMMWPYPVFWVNNDLCHHRSR